MLRAGPCIGERRLGVPVGEQQGAVGRIRRDRPAVREAAHGQDAVEQTGIRVGHLLLVDGAAGAAAADGVPDGAVRIDDVLLEHLDRFGLHHDVAVLSVVVERGSGHHHAA